MPRETIITDQEPQLTSSQEGFQKLTDEAPSFEENYRTRKVSSTMQKFSKDYQAARRKFENEDAPDSLPSLYEADDPSQREFDPFAHHETPEKSGKMLSIYDMANIILSDGISPGIPQEDIQSFGDNYLNAVLRTPLFPDKNLNDEEQSDFESLKTTLDTLRNHGFKPFKDGINLRLATTESVFSDSPASRAENLGLVDGNLKAQVAIQGLQENPEPSAKDYSNPNDYNAALNKFVTVLNYAERRLASPELDQETKTQILELMPDRFQGYYKYAEAMPGGLNNLKKDALIPPESSAMIKDRFFTKDGPTNEFWQALFDSGNFDQIEQFHNVTIDASESQNSDARYTEMGLNRRQQDLLREYDALNPLVRPAFAKAVSKNKKYEVASTDNLSAITKNIKKLGQYASESPEIRSHIDSFVELVLEKIDDPDDISAKIDSIESVFARDDLPYVAKAFSTFQIMHPPNTLPTAFSNFSEDERRASPVLMELADNRDGEEMSGVIYSDLFKIAAGSNNSSLREKVASTNPQIKEYMDYKISEADTRNREAAKHPFRLQSGDMVKGLGGIKYLPDSLQNGIVCKELLGADAQSDTTPLDTDLSLIESSADSPEGAMSQLEANQYGPLWIVLKSDENRDGPDRFSVTRRAPAEADKPVADTIDRDKIEVFHTGRTQSDLRGRTHMGIRTGFASSEIDFFIADSEEISKAASLEIVKNGFYIPIIDKHTGNLLFAPEQYDQMASNSTK